MLDEFSPEVAGVVVPWPWGFSPCPVFTTQRRGAPHSWEEGGNRRDSLFINRPRSVLSICTIGRKASVWVRILVAHYLAVDWPVLVEWFWEKAFPKPLEYLVP